MTDDKTNAIVQWPQPKGTRDVRRFLGLCNFYRQFIPHMSTIAAPLHALTGKLPWTWGQDQQTAFTELKSHFRKDAQKVLAIPNHEDPFFVETDASDVATGGVLYQKTRTNLFQPCAFISQSLLPAEQRYEIFDRELLAVVRAFQNWQHYLQHSKHPVTVWTDHKNLTYYRTLKRLTPRQVRWQCFLSLFNIELAYKP